MPYLPPVSKFPSRAGCVDQPYTLVLDLDETLIHYEVDEAVNAEDEDPGYYLIRPGAMKFLQLMSEYFEVVVFTAAMPDYADWILDNLDREDKFISHRLYRQHTTPNLDYAIKDLRNLGRSLEQTLIIDNLSENYESTTPNNGLQIPSWYDDMDDTCLTLLMPYLISLVERRQVIIVSKALVIIINAQAKLDHAVDAASELCWLIEVEA